jgi:hypothetical protein
MGTGSRRLVQDVDEVRDLTVIGAGPVGLSRRHSGRCATGAFRS